MITIKDFMETVNYRVTEGGEYCWKCFGENAYRLESWNGEQDGHSVSIVFDTVTQTVYEVESFDYARNRAYRWQNPDYKLAHDTEACERGIDAREAWDEVRFVELEVEEDFLEKSRCIVQGVEYDTRVQIEVDFNDDELLRYMKYAHEQDITFNELVERALVEKLQELESISKGNSDV